MDKLTKRNQSLQLILGAAIFVIVVLSMELYVKYKELKHTEMQLFEMYDENQSLVDELENIYYMEEI